MSLHSPNELFEAACDMMLDGRRPVTEGDWQIVVNFFAANIAREVVTAAMPVMKLLFQIPLEDDVIDEIVRFQLAVK